MWQPTEGAGKMAWPLQPSPQIKMSRESYF